MRGFGLKMNGKQMRMKIEWRLLGLWRWDSVAISGLGWMARRLLWWVRIFPRKRKEKEKEKERKVMDLKNKEKDKVMGKVKQTLWTHHILLNPLCSKQLYLRQRVPLVSLWHIQQCTWHQSRWQRVKIKVMEPDLSGPPFLGQEPNPVQKVEEGGVAFHTENQMPPTVAILDLGCARAMGSRNAVNAFCDYVDKHDCGLWYKIEENKVKTISFANSQQTKCTEKLVIHMYDKAWNAHTTEFDIVKEMYLYWCHFHRWETLVFNLSFHHRSHSWIVQDWEFGSINSGCQRAVM